MQLVTRRGYPLGVVVSAMQKSIRRGDGRMAGYWALEMYASGYEAYAWRRLFIISAEDCWGIITKEVEALHNAYQVVAPNEKKKEVKAQSGQLFIIKAAMILAAAKKCRDADHLINLVYWREPTASEMELIQKDLDEATAEPIPECALDCHTSIGRKRGKTKGDFIVDEFEALNPREPGLFDDYVQRPGGRPRGEAAPGPTWSNH